ncbi:unnamed protein product [Lampetra planeri]
MVPYLWNGPEKKRCSDSTTETPPLCVEAEVEPIAASKQTVHEMGAFVAAGRPRDGTASLPTETRAPAPATRHRTPPDLPRALLTRQ